MPVNCMEIKEPTTISAAIRLYSMAVTADVSLISLLKNIIIGGLHSQFDVAQRRLKSLLKY
jgi:hypothetical protein